ncbi:hypothetical protein OGH69_08995 [Flavobacterium sp. MFBS3-15]|uniref:hypothetical protein n=1 Tax=Flavobacterium sp. MFBS3-15 TaxID=2989816 RepID=UPI00223649C3|nr:hypothetical protein [Flavobacterium sp. MFBS3-15]MCW4469098.1 hypothetical protein [Flavobacterium sp. MFBS3-15]
MKNPKIEVYRVILSPSSERRKEFYSFREFFIKKYGLKENAKDDKIFNKFFTDMFKSDNPDYNEDGKRRKAFRLSNDVKKGVNNFVIHGVLEGGPYDVGKSTGDRRTKRESKKLGKNIIIQDDFYFLLQTKLDKKVGILILQSYGTDKIDDIFRPFIKKLFKLTGQTYEAVVAPHFPTSFADLARNTAIVSELNYQTNNLVVNQLSEDGRDKLSGKFNVKIIITPVNESIPVQSLPKWKKIINKALFKFPENEMELESFNTKAGYLKSDTLKNPARFEINNDNISIQPSIYLEKIDSVVINENGNPDWETLKVYCINELLPELEEEIYGED